MRQNTLLYSVSSLCVLMLLLLLPACNASSSSNTTITKNYQRGEETIQLKNLSLEPTNPNIIQSFAATLRTEQSGAAMLAVVADNPQYSNARTTSSDNAICATVSNDQNCDGMSHLQQACSMDRKEIGLIGADLDNIGNVHLGQLYLISSQQCQSSWARVIPVDPFSPSISSSTYQGVLYVGIEEISVTRDDGKSMSYNPPSGKQRMAFTGMIYVPVQKVEACVIFQIGILGKGSYKSYMGHSTEACTKAI
jgi:hypothetical protein